MHSPGFIIGIAKCGNWPSDINRFRSLVKDIIIISLKYKRLVKNVLINSRILSICDKIYRTLFWNRMCFGRHPLVKEKGRDILNRTHADISEILSLLCRSEQWIKHCIKKYPFHSDKKLAG